MKIPIYWINLKRDVVRRKRMEYSLSNGGWINKRWDATDAENKSQIFLPLIKFWQKGSVYPGILRSHEKDSQRITTRSELACLSSWKRLLNYLNNQKELPEWLLLMEDDVGSSLLTPKSWPFSLEQLINEAEKDALLIQMAPINGNAKIQLFNFWQNSGGKILLIPKTEVRSHGNGALLVHKNAIRLLYSRINNIFSGIFKNIHLLSHPRNVRPVADKWIYSALPRGSCYVATFPIFCLESETSSINQAHINTYHRASRKVTLDLWQQAKSDDLIIAHKQIMNIY